MIFLLLISLAYLLVDTNCYPLFSLRCNNLNSFRYKYNFFISTLKLSNNNEIKVDENLMSLDELKAELDLRQVDYSECITKGELANKLRSTRLSGKADPSIIDKFNENTDLDTNDFDPSLIDLDSVTAKDGNLPGGLSPEVMKLMAADPEIMNMLKDPKMQEIMKAMMTGGT